MATKRLHTKPFAATRPRIGQSTVRRILVPLDFSPASLNAASLASSLARQLGAEARCITVVDVLDLPFASRADLPEFETNTDLKRQIRAWIDRKFDELRSTTGQDIELEVRRGIPEDEILKAVRRYKPDLIVMGSTGLARRIPLGSRTRAVIRGTVVPVLVVQPEESPKKTEPAKRRKTPR